MSYYESGFWHQWFDDEALQGERLDADLVQQLLGQMAMEDTVAYGGVEDGMGNISSDADPGL